MTRFITIFIISLMFTTNLSAKPKRDAAPDFAYPDKVAANSGKALTQALRDNDPQAIIDASVQYALARTMVDEDNVNDVLDSLTETATATSDSCVRSMLDLVKASIYSSLYNSNRWKYDSRELPDAPVPSDYKQWSGRRFATVIDSLVSRAASPREALISIPVTAYNRTVVIGRNAIEYYPTLYDFVLTKGISLLTGLNRGDMRILPVSALTDTDCHSLTRHSGLNQVTRSIISLYNDRIDAHPAPSAARLRAQVDRLQFIRGLIYADDVISSPEEIAEAYNSALAALYENGRQYPWAAIALLDSDTGTGTTGKLRLHHLLDDALKTHPSNSLAPNIKAMADELTCPSAALHYRSTAAPGRPFDVTLTLSNARSCQLRVSRVTGDVSNDANRIKQSTPRHTVESIDVNTGERPVIYTDTITVQVTLPSFGVYAIEPVIDGVTDKNSSPDIIRCTSLALITASVCDDTRAIVVDNTDGSPVADAGINIMSGGYARDTHFGSVTADSIGMARITSPQYGRLYPVAGDDRYAPASHYYIGMEEDDDTDFDAILYTSLPLYHHGDTLKGVVIAYSHDLNGRRPLADTHLDVVLRDPNYREVSRCSADTDGFGRATFDFTLPVGGLSGNHSVSAVLSNNLGIGSLSVPVSDYKLPTYEVSVDSISGDMNRDGKVTISGRATYYSGFPVADAGVAVTMRGVRRSWWRSVTTPVFYNTECRTDADGRFHFTVDRATAMLCPVTGVNIEATVTVTAGNGETCMATTTFATGRPYTINASLQNDIEASARTACYIRATDALGHGAELPVTISFMQKGDTVMTIDAVTPVSSLDLTGLVSGSYTVRIAPRDPSEADCTGDLHTTLYRPDDTICPAASPLWVPRRSYTVTDADSTAAVIYGNDTAADILVTTVCRGSITDMRWLKANAGQHRLSIPVTDRTSPTTVTLTRVHDGRLYDETITLNPAQTLRSVNLSIESFRDKVLAGDTENWLVRVSPTDGSQVAAALLMTMYCKALTTLATQPWDADFLQSAYDRLGMSMPYNIVYDSFSLPLKLHKLELIEAPSLNTYGRSFAGNSIYIRGTMRKYAAAQNLSMAGGAEEEEALDSSLMLAESVTVDSGVADMAGQFAENGAGGITPDNPDNNETYREAEVASAFFAPMLTTGADGTLQYSFTVPDANTAWQLNALAYTAGLLSDSRSLMMTSSKPVMVNANLPRFVRRGDRLDIIATVMNNTDNDADITAHVRITDPTTGSTVASCDSTLHLAASSSGTVVLPVCADTQGSALLYRIRAAGGLHTDGEQLLLPVLDATQPVIESTPFYIAPDSVTTVINLPAAHTGSQVTLQLCENIAWEVVTALPGLRSDDSQTANAAMARIFSASVARGLMRSNPSIAAAIRDWSDSDRSDSTLVSMLERNNDLKIMMLSASPWIETAATDSERMSRLVLLFDNKLIDNTITRDIKLLASLQTQSGGLRWMAGSDSPSSWATTNVLNGLAELRRLGYMPDDSRLGDIISKALTYIDSETADDYRKHPDGDYTYYAWLRTSFDDAGLSTASRRVIDSAVQRAIDTWRESNLTDKAVKAMLLNRTGYAATAAQIIGSLRRFAVIKPDKGMYWPRLQSQHPMWGHQIAATSILLDAFAEVEPQSADIDLIRQWMIVNKTTQDWGSGVQTTEIIASILSSGTSWTKPAAGVEITVGHRQVAIPAADSRTGYFVTDITGLTGSGDSDITIVKPGRYPSFGAVIDRHTSTMRDTAAKGCDELTISKRHLVLRGTEWVESDEFKVGDIVKISLTLTVSQGMDYVAVVDNRAACLEPVNQLPAPVFADGLYFYRENRDSATNLFIDRLPKGVYILEYEMKVTNAGDFASGIATAQSQYAPAMTAHSGGTSVTVINSDSTTLQ